MILLYCILHLLLVKQRLLISNISGRITEGFHVPEMYFFSFYVSFWHKRWLHRIMAVQKWHRSHFHHAIRSATRLDFFHRKTKQHWGNRPKLGEALFFPAHFPPGNGGTTELTVQKRKNHTDGKGKEGDRNRIKTRVNNQTFTWWRTPVLNLLPRWYIYYLLSTIYSYQWDLRQFTTSSLSTGPVSNTTCLLINTTRSITAFS